MAPLGELAARADQALYLQTKEGLLNSRIPWGRYRVRSRSRVPVVFIAKTFLCKLSILTSLASSV